MTLEQTMNRTLHIPAGFGALPPDWTWSRLDDVCDGVFDCPHSTPELTEHGPYVARSQDIRTGVFRFEQAARVSEETYQERIRRAKPQHGDLLYSREGTYFGIAAEVPINSQICLGQRMVLIRPNQSKIHFRFLRFWLNSPLISAFITGFRDGSVAERLNLPVIRGLPIVIPPLETQKAIASVLGALDDKIELNRRMNRTLESMARAIFKSWFVDFDPVKANVEGRSLEGLSADVQKMFPSSFDGDVPTGWKIGTFDELGHLARQTLNPNGFPDEFFDHFSIPAFDTGQVPVNEPGSGIMSNKTVVQPGSILISKLNPRTPRVWLPTTTNERRPIASTEFMVVVPRDPSIREFIYCTFTSDGFTETFSSKVTGTSNSHQRVKPSDLMGAEMVLPSANLITHFSSSVQPMLERIASARLESQILAATRDALLPKLLSGEVRVDEAEQEIGAAG